MSDLEEEYRLEYFEENDFHRTQCSSCGVHFWTRDADRDTCGEPPCGAYTFFEQPGFDREYSLEEMRETFLSFFEEHDHTRIDPYPVAANRWRDDVLLTQASIYDFQPLVTSGRTPPPANPLCISQPCIRMQDIDNVGKTGRHTMAFEMMAHHAFNTRDSVDSDEYAYHGEVYWKNETVEYCDAFLAELGADLEAVTYIEDPWVGGGNAGPALEVIYEGVELATLVFMSMEQDEEGEYLLKDGNRYSKMDTYIVDTGYGLERWTWVSQGTPTIYEAVYPEMIEFLLDNAGIFYDADERAVVHEAATLAGRLDIDEAEDIEAARSEIAARVGVEPSRLAELQAPLEKVYAIADHARTLAYMLGDGIVPSNVASGYLARMVLRRTKRLCDTVGVDAPLDELVDMQARRLGYSNRDTIRDIVRTEVEKYRKTLDRGGRRVRQLASSYADRKESIPTEELIELYDSHGIQPDMVAEIAEEEGATVSVPEDFYSLVAARHDAEASGADSEATDIEERIADLPETEKLFYEDQARTEFEAVIIDVIDRPGAEGYDVVLDQTMFYPEGGGQPPDHGTLATDSATVDVVDVQEIEGVVVHRTTGPLTKGEFVKGKVDRTRRRRLMRHHTATHIIGHAARQVLGDHIRQAGAQKGTESARLDIRHYRRVDRAEVKEIERVANNLVMADVPVAPRWLDRNEAEQEYGFDLYQGGIPAGSDIRIIEIGEDVQACGGTHVAKSGEVGTIKVLRTERIQDGVERVTFAAGEAAIDATQRVEDALYEAAEILDVSPQDVPETAERFFEEWKERGKRIEELKSRIAELQAGEGTTVELPAATAVIQRIDGDAEQLRATANELVAEGQVAVLGGGVDDANFVVAVPDDVEIHAGEVVSELAAIVGGGGGGPADFAQGGGPDADRIDEALEAAPDILKRIRNA